jgi:hypothetical protein
MLTIVGLIILLMFLVVLAVQGVYLISLFCISIGMLIMISALANYLKKVAFKGDLL